MTLRRLYRRHGTKHGRMVLETCVKARLAPVKDWAIEGVADLMFGDNSQGNLTGDAIATAILAAGPRLGPEAHVMQAQTGRRMPECYATVIRKYAK